ncbi:hypothetical protein PWT90_05322 [Aphanocladium album]|nr:hypothetical protein PWT90_05322 [Aphanocladium album]
MDLLSMCESLASNISEYDAKSSSEILIDEVDIEHWQLLFKLTRQPLSQDAWEMIKDTQSAKVFSKESYEYYLGRGRKLKKRTALGGNGTNMYLLRIHESSRSLCMVQELLGTNEIQVLPGSDDDGNTVQFCYLDASMSTLLLNSLASSASIHFQPSFIRVSFAKKDFDINSRHTTLGIKTTLPQYRPDSTADFFEPTLICARFAS